MEYSEWPDSHDLVPVLDALTNWKADEPLALAVTDALYFAAVQQAVGNYVSSSRDETLADLWTRLLAAADARLTSFLSTPSISAMTLWFSDEYFGGGRRECMYELMLQTTNSARPTGSFWFRVGDWDVLADAVSPFRLEGSGPWCPAGGVTPPLEPEIRQAAFGMLKNAFDQIEDVMPAASHRLGRHLRVVVPMIGGIGSASTRAYNGRAIISRPSFDCGAEAMCWCVDALVHESVHSLMYKFEPFCQFLDESSATVTVVSPWTGAVLNVHSYLHAVFVWFALAHFWTQWGEVAPMREADGGWLERRRRSLSGFRGEVLARLQPASVGIHPRLLDGIREMEIRVQDLM